jgi:hypothetical protein
MLKKRVDAWGRIRFLALHVGRHKPCNGLFSQAGFLWAGTVRFKQCVNGSF